VAAVCRSGYFHLRQLRLVIRCSSEDVTKFVVTHSLPVDWMLATRCTMASLTTWSREAPPPVDPERCHSIGDGHSAMRPHFTSSPPAALLSVRQRVQFKVATLVYQALSGHDSSNLADNCCLVIDVRPTILHSADSNSSVRRGLTSATESLVQLNLESANICRHTSDLSCSRFRQSLKSFYLVSGNQSAVRSI